MSNLGGLPALAVQSPTPPNPLEEFARVAQIKSQMQSQQLQSQEMQLRQQQITDQQATTTAMRNWDPSTGDYDGLAKSVLQNHGSATAAMAIQQHGLQVKQLTANLTKDQTANYIQGHKIVGDMLSPLTDPEQVPDEELHKRALDTTMELINRGFLPKADGAQAIQQIQSTNDPAQLRQGIGNLAKVSQGAAATAAQQKTAAETAEATSKGKQAEAEAAKANLISIPELGIIHHIDTGINEPMSGNTMTPGMMESKYIQNQAQKAKTGTSPDPNFDKAYEHMKTLVPAFNFNLQNSGTTGNVADVAQHFGMTPTAFDQAAEKYWTSGVLPPAGRGGPALAMNKALMNRAADLHPEGSLAANSAEYKANAASLEKIQGNFDQVSAFENTANKNLDLFLNKLESIHDLKVKFLNTPMRAIDSSMIGSDNYQAMRAAQQTAATETAKVLGSANASGVLSDTQKKDAEDILSGNLSLSAARKVVDTLKQDFGNRHQSYADQISDIKKRMGAPPAANAPQDFFGKFGGKARAATPSQ